MEKVSSSSGVSLVGAARGKFVESLVGEGRGAEEAGEMVQQCTHVIGATSIIIATWRGNIIGFSWQKGFEAI